MREHILKATDWVLPPAFFRLLSYYRPAALGFYLKHRDVLRANRQLRGCHAGGRCFILCNGPSVLEQDIRPLRGEVVFSVSNGFRHPDYQTISPRYHCVPQLTYAALPEDEAIKWFELMHASIGDAEMFLDQQEWSLVRQHQLFAGRKTHFVCMGKNHFPATADIPDLSGIIPRVQSVPIMVLMVALYMGFREIYLLGTDHDWFVKKEYRFFYGHSVTATDATLTRDGTLLTTLWDELPAVAKVWGQYRAIKRIAQAHGAKIYNATHGGMLDEFERVRLEDVVK